MNTFYSMILSFASKGQPKAVFFFEKLISKKYGINLLKAALPEDVK